VTGVQTCALPISHHKILAGDEVVVELTEADVSWGNIKPENIPLDIFYEDQWLLVVNKPAGMLVHPVHGSRCGTLVNALLHHYQTLSDVNASFRPGIVHRLDRETSGLMLVAKDNVTHVRLARQFEKHRIQKRYLALVAGHIKFDEGVIDAPLGRHHVHWDKRGVSFDEEAKDAKTFYRVIKRFDKPVTLVALFPESGRTHQLRVHMAYLGHPILGDDKYGDRNSFPRLALHAQAICFLHPQTQCEIEFFSVAPKEFLSP
jgi:23S rRNA pseudouridine1911/1915/1917 synthase